MGPALFWAVAELDPPRDQVQGQMAECNILLDDGKVDGSLAVGMWAKMVAQHSLQSPADGLEVKSDNDCVWQRSVVLGIMLEKTVVEGFVI